MAVFNSSLHRPAARLCRRGRRPEPRLRPTPPRAAPRAAQASGGRFDAGRRADDGPIDEAVSQRGIILYPFISPAKWPKYHFIILTAIVLGCCVAGAVAPGEIRGTTPRGVPRLGTGGDQQTGAQDVQFREHMPGAVGQQAPLALVGGGGGRSGDGDFRALLWREAHLPAPPRTLRATPPIFQATPHGRQRDQVVDGPPAFARVTRLAAASALRAPNLARRGSLISKVAPLLLLAHDLVRVPRQQMRELAAPPLAGTSSPLCQGRRRDRRPKPSAHGREARAPGLVRRRRR
mmetsp:Transcript_45281/g.145126  ORF Transcript_45281/g.145126 Transcript_45281/m.145126 type:complete len:291 (+) Transcript_45281:110-982(+)